MESSLKGEALCLKYISDYYVDENMVCKYFESFKEVGSVETKYVFQIKKTKKTL